MARGGKREGAGRKMGSQTKRTQEIIEKASQAGIMPLEYMLDVMRKSKDTKRRDAMAIAAAAYVHPRLSAIEANVKASVSHDEIVADMYHKAKGEAHEQPN